jgi:hypothetical protein
VLLVLNSSLHASFARERRGKKRAAGTLVLASLRDAWAWVRMMCSLTRGVASLNPSLQAGMAPPSGETRSSKGLDGASKNRHCHP